MKQLLYTLAGLLLVMSVAANGYGAGMNDEKILKSCEEDKNAFACFEVGEKYRVLDRDNKNALIYFEKACAGDHILGCVHQGNLVQNKGQQYSKHWKKASKLFKKACDADLDAGCFNLGTLYYREGRAKKAQKFYQKACDLNKGHAAACKNAKNLKR